MKKTLLGLNILLCFLLAGCGFGASSFTSSVNYDNADQYTIGGSTLTEPIRQLEIDWVSGSVTVCHDDTQTISFAETANRDLSEDLTMRWWLEGENLHIKFCKSGKWNIRDLEKDLTVTLPSTLRLEEVDITAVSARIDAPGLWAAEAELSTTSGDISAQLLETADWELHTVSGAVSAAALNPADSAEAESTSGSLKLELGTVTELRVETVSGKTEVSADQIDRSSLNSTSGNVTLSLKNAGGTHKIGTVSGQAELFLPQDTQLSVDYDTVSGTLSTEIEPVETGQTKIQVSTTSGDLHIRKAS